MFNDSIALAVVAAARNNGIDPASLLAMVEVETGGKAFEADGRTPALLFERHVAWREAAKVSKTVLAAFRRAGLAIPHWDKATQYKDERTSAQRIDLIRRAKAIHPEVACRSASWGLGQTMGFLCDELGYGAATRMVDAITGNVPAQIEAMVREIKNKDLVKSLNAHDWARVARLYNGKGYAKNAYDVKLRDAYKRWSRKLPQLGTVDQPRAAPPEQKLARDEIQAIQEKLRDLGYHEVGTPDGVWGTKTTAAISAFQAHEGLEVNGQYDPRTKAAFEHVDVQPRPHDDERTTATVDDLRKSGSDTIKHADDVGFIGKIKAWLGGLLLTGGAADAGGVLGKAQDGLDKVDQAKGLWERVSEFHGLLTNPVVIVLGIALLVGGIAIAIYAERIRQNRLKDHQAGEHAGPTPGGDE